MANITTELSGDNVRVTFRGGRQGRHLRITEDWTDWMLSMEDFRDLIIPLNENDINQYIEEVINNSNNLNFLETEIGQEYILNDYKKIIRRVGPGNVRREYQGVALFARNEGRIFPPPPIEVSKAEILSLLRAMITLNLPRNYCHRDCLRNLQYFLAMFWVKKDNPDLFRGEKKPKSNEIFRISLVK